MTTPNHAFCARCGLRKQLCRDRCAGETQLELTVEGFKRDIWVWVMNARTRIRICTEEFAPVYVGSEPPPPEPEVEFSPVAVTPRAVVERAVDDVVERAERLRVVR
jgi:hypothetical protein